MKEGFLKQQWKKYRARKSTAGIILDFLFIVLFVAMIIPSSRSVISSSIIRYTMTRTPETEQEVRHLTSTDKQWQIRSLEEEAFTLKQFEGKVLFINIWATWCPPCIAEMPSIARLYKEYGDRVEFLIVSGEKTETIQKFLLKKKHDIPVYQVETQLPKAFKTQSIPATFIISKTGKIVLGKEGAADWDANNIKELLDQLIAE